MSSFLAAVFGLIFGLGIVISGMGNPEKVIAFFDVTSGWDPSLAFVMGGALLTTAIGYRFILTRARPILAPRFSMPSTNKIDPPLIIGSMIFGIGWGITGFCPGAVVPMLATGHWQPAVFIGGLIAALIATRAWRLSAANPALKSSSR